MTMFLSAKSMFITATDTGVGKTFVAAGLARAFRDAGVDIGVMKPIATACRRASIKEVMAYGDIVSDDALILRDNAGTDDILDFINPIRYEQPVAPFVAAKLSGRNIRLDQIFSAYRRLMERHEFLIIEGIGGLMVPILEDYYVSDLIKSLEAPAIIVARPNLGTLNHTLLTIREAQRSGIEVLGVIINHYDKIEDDLSIQTNPEIMEECTGVPILGVIPFSDSIESCCHEFKAISERMMRQLIRKV